MTWSSTDQRKVGLVSQTQSTDAQKLAAHAELAQLRETLYEAKRQQEEVTRQAAKVAACIAELRYSRSWGQHCH